METTGLMARLLNMDQSHWHEEEGSIAYRRNQPVRSRPIHEGIGDALREAFDSSQLGLPDDIRTLLAQLR